MCRAPQDWAAFGFPSWNDHSNGCANSQPSARDGDGLTRTSSSMRKIERWGTDAPLEEWYGVAIERNGFVSASWQRLRPAPTRDSLTANHPPSTLTGMNMPVPRPVLAVLIICLSVTLFACQRVDEVTPSPLPAATPTLTPTPAPTSTPAPTATPAPTPTQAHRRPRLRQHQLF